MSKYYVRIELHKATSEEYDDLHAKMKKGGFLTYVPGSDGKNYQLPTAMYFADVNQSKEEVYAVANLIANSVRESNWILVVKSAGAHFKLDKVK